MLAHHAEQGELQEKAGVSSGPDGRLAAQSANQRAVTGSNRRLLSSRGCRKVKANIETEC